MVDNEDPQDEQFSDEVDRTISIYLNSRAFRVHEGSVTGDTLKQLPNPPIGPDYDLVRIVPGDAQDLFVRPDEVIDLEDQDAFFTVPQSIMAGQTPPFR